MKDSVSIPRVKELHCKIRDEVAELIGKIEFANPHMTIRIVQGFRSIEYQNELYAQGRTKPGQIVTKAVGGKSFHNYGLAIDFAILYDGKISWDIEDDKDNDGISDWMEVVSVFKAAGYVWGGNWVSIKDYPHFEKGFSYTTSKLKEKYDNGDVFLDRNGFKYVNV